MTAVTPGPTPKTMADVHDLAALLAELDVTGEAAGEARYQAPDPSRGDLSELNRELDDILGTTAPEPLDMSDQALADLLESLDECLRTGDEVPEAEVEGGNHPAPEEAPKPPRARMAPFVTPAGAARRMAPPMTSAGEGRRTGGRARIHTPRCESPH